ncbi:MAG: hypothetical protein R2769_11510 [Saprospiraceae bacterium]
MNDYLARRDAEWNRPIFEFLFLTVDCIDKYRPHSAERRAAYNHDITYGTNNEFGSSIICVITWCVAKRKWFNANTIIPWSMRWTCIDDDARTPFDYFRS